ncbi:hypothetical protein, partial [Vibrio gazogenes]|uniref:hypothetical protein n=1 Tax=Vibrio gazogenes TaxID=687 RepID=UPI001967150C
TPTPTPPPTPTPTPQPPAASQIEAGRIVNNMPIVNDFVPNVRNQSVRYNTNTGRTATATNGEPSDEVMSTQDSRLSGSMCFVGSDFAITCSSK